MKQSFRYRLQKFEPLLGTIISFPSPEIAEIFAEAGFDWLFVDLEHSAMDIANAQAILQAVAERSSCILRVPQNDEIWIKKGLDTGASGVMIPQINNLEAAQRAVRFCKYPPQGMRSVGITRAQAYGAHFQEYVENSNSDVAVIIQIEHTEAVKNIEEILTADGIDAVLLGPYDLSASMGLMGQVDHPDVQTALTRVRKACLGRQIPCGIFTIETAKIKLHLAEGYTLLALSSDAIMLMKAAKVAMQAL